LSWRLKISTSVPQQPRKRGSTQSAGPDLRDLLECLRLLKRVRWKVRRRPPQRYVSIPAKRPEPVAADEGVTPTQSPERIE
jgi:hypothetical protein